MAKSWYIVQTFTGYEQKIEREIRRLLDEKEIDSAVLTDIKVPMEEVSGTTKTGKKTTHHNKLLPGYIMLEMDLPQIGWKATCSKVRAIRGVNGFVGTGSLERPRPISSEEARNILQQTGAIKGERVSRVRQNYDVGDNVKITEGPFATFSGTVEEISTERNKLRVNVQIFGRVTPVEVDFSQVEKI